MEKYDAWHIRIDFLFELSKDLDMLMSDVSYSHVNFKTDANVSVFETSVT